ncbi:MAG: hypothetical protein PHH23_02185 [Paludibacteraceae bacterium]|jgi:Flp pilus assembly CpaF family ATPase|nr:hypothetical protein [Paludibacteraceae bacterium]
MSQQPDLIEFDDDDAIEFIINRLPKALRSRISEDDVQYVLDLICDFYEKNNLIEDEEVEEATIAEDDMFRYIDGIMRKENVIELTEEELRTILDGEYEYGKSIGIYTEED